MTLRFNIGDTVWIASWESVSETVECPHCGGTGRIRVTFHDETTVSIGCGNCSRGYEAPTGRVGVYVRTPIAICGVVTGIDTARVPIEWMTTSRHGDDDHTFATEHEALLHAAIMCSEADAAERKKVADKERDTRSWAWNASYHRNEIKEAKRRIEHHESKLSVASLKAKEDRRLAR